MAIAITLELANNIDIQVSQMTGLLRDPQYAQVLQSYDLDANQCLLWWEISQLLSDILAQYDYEDVELKNAALGLEVKKLLAENPKKFTYIAHLLNQYKILHHNPSIGRVIQETIEDIGNVYRSISQELQKILASQKEIQAMVENSEEDEYEDKKKYLDKDDETEEDDENE